MNHETFLSRWSRRKAQKQSGEALAPAAEPVEPQPIVAENEPGLPLAPVEAEVAAPAAAPPEPLPTLEDVAALTRESSYARFVAPGVDENVKRAAMKKLFADPQFNLMDGLDTYIDDYGKPDPIPQAMLRQMVQSQMLRLFEDDAEKEKTAAVSSTDASTAALTQAPPDENTAVRLQPDDAAGPIEPGAHRPGPRS